MANLDIIIYVLMIGSLIAISILAAKYYKGLGIFGALLGALFAYICFTSENLVLNTFYDQTAQVFVNQLYPMGFFAWVPLVLTALCFAVVVK